MEKSNQAVEKSGTYQKKCLGGYFDLSSKTHREFFFKFQKITSVNFVGPDPRLLEIGA